MKEEQKITPQNVSVTKLVYKGLQGVRRVRAVKESVIDEQLARLVKKFGCADEAELLRCVPDYQSVAQIRADLHRAKELQYEQIEETALQDSLLTQAATAMELALPMAMLSARVEQALAAQEKSHAAQGKSLADYLALIGQSRAEYQQALLAQETLAFCKEVVIEQVTQAENIVVSPQEIAAEYQRIANYRGTSVADAQKGLTEQTIARALTVRKVRALLVEYAEITTATI